jgi:methionyl-tRNA formyltransferase
MNKKDLKIVFYGTPDFAVKSLQAIIDAGYNVVAVVTAPDKPAGRGKKLTQSPVKKYAVEQNLKVLQPEKLKDPAFLEELKKLRPDLQVVVAFRMLPKEVWSLPPLGTFNLHASLLPQYRGASPINFALINGEKETGLTTFFIDDKIDTGNIILQEKTQIKDTDNFESLHDKMMLQGADLVVRTIETILKGNFKLINQNDLIKPGETLKPAPKINKKDCEINWNRPVDEVYNFIRGLSPWPAAFTMLKDKEGKELYVKIFKVEKENHVSQNEPGQVETDNKNFLRIYCKDGSILVKELQLPGKKRMKTVELLRGFSFDDRVTTGEQN